MNQQNPADMLRFLSRMVLVAASSAVIVPYTTAVLCHLLFGRQPLGRFVKRNLTPRRVYALNLALLQSLLLRVRYTPLYLRWRSYYNSAEPSLLIKNLAFGRNNCCLDLHLPRSHRLTSPRKDVVARPVVVFVYGGTWSSGDKSMYAALMRQIAERLNVLVCCPNYSKYPQGCVDDMIQDLVDCIQWIHDSIQDYGGDKTKLMLIGHSAGAHLGAMALLELLHDQRTHSTPHSAATSMHFHHSHYGRVPSDPGSQLRDPLEESSGSSESFAVVSENGEGGADRGDTHASSLDGSVLSSMVQLSQDDLAAETKQRDLSASAEKDPSTAPVPSETGAKVEASLAGTGQRLVGMGRDGAMPGEGDDGTKLELQGAGDGAEGEEESCEDDNDDDNDSVVTVRPKEIERHPTLVDLCSTVKAFVGLAGVYDIGDHYQHEAWRGVEDYSSMEPAMYGADHFARFSPTCILQALDSPISLPRMVLVHGTGDIIVPVSASQKMAEALANVSSDVSLRIIPSCDHYDVCFDLMMPSRHFHASLMTILLETANTVF